MYLNTTLVNVNQLILKKATNIYLNLNTTLVNVNHPPSSVAYEPCVNLNTTLVNVNPLKIPNSYYIVYYYKWLNIYIYIKFYQVPKINLTLRY